MSAEAHTLQCYRCAGYLRVAAHANQRVKCPHCGWEAVAGEFRLVRPDELGTGAAGLGGPATASVEVGQGAWVLKGKYLEFACPNCERPMRMLPENAGGLTDCPHCMLEVIAPDPGSGAAARLSDASLRRLGGGGERIKTRPSLHSARRFQTPTPEPEPEAELKPASPSPFAMGEPQAEPPGPNPFAVDPADQPPGASSRATVKVLGLEQLGAAFQARDDLEFGDTNTWEERDAAPRSQDKVFTEGRSRAFAMVAAVILSILGILFVVLEFRRRNESAVVARGAAADVVAESEAASQRIDRAFDVACRATGAAGWREVLPLVRARQRVEPIMAAFYRERSFEPVPLVSVLESIEVPSAQVDYLQLRVEDQAGHERLVVLEETADGEFLFDWELWVDIARIEWERFREHRPEEPVALRVTIARSSALPKFAEDAGLGVDDARCLRIWLNDPGDSLYALFPKSDAEGARLWDDMSWDLGRRVVAEVAFPRAAGQAERVELRRIVQSRWLLP